MRHDKAAQVLFLARRLAASAEGLTLDEMARELDVGRRTAERLRDAVRELFPVEDVEDPPTRRFRIPGGLDGLFQAPTADELTALRRAADTASASGGRATASALRTLEAKILSATRAAARRRLAPDVEALVQAEAIALQSGPRPFEDEGVLAVIREALLSGRALSFRYNGGSNPGSVREVTPYGLLFGRANYLVAPLLGEDKLRNWRLDLVEQPELLARWSSPPPGFSLQAYADRSFGIYQDEAEDVVLRFTPDAARNALRWRFHPGQTVEALEDGSVRVRFRAAGMRELAHHLFTWGDAVAIEAPDRLRALLVDQLRTALAAHAPA
jgi:predicted DNA-binding transcriptional regulator YafY